MYVRISDPGIGPYPTRVVLSLRAPGWGFHTVWGGIDLGDLTAIVPSLLEL